MGSLYSQQKYTIWRRLLDGISLKKIRSRCPISNSELIIPECCQVNFLVFYASALH